MKKALLGIPMGLSLLLACTKGSNQNNAAVTENITDTKPRAAVPATPNFQLIWSEEFNATGNFDANKWSFCPRGAPAWARYLTADAAYANLAGGNLKLRMDNAVIAGDAVPYHSGGVQSKGKFNLTYGKIEVRAKFNQGQGSWPAIWMMPDDPVAYGGWPNSGEIDIMEHVNFENVMHQTIHNGSVTNANGGSTATQSSPYNVNDFNIYSIVWTPVNIQFYVNNVLRYTYTKAANATSQQWPFDKPFYVILNQAGGAGWPGAITNSHLPFTMDVDYVRVYKSSLLSNGGFETGSLTPWTTWGSTSQLVTSDVRTGTRAVRETGSGQTAIEQEITGLTPNTNYRFGGFGKVSVAGQSITLGAKNFGGVAVNSAITSTGYTHSSVGFTTGASNTSAVLYLYKPGSGTAFGDDFYLEKVQ
jgi:beta-glucanase (GH16 family)